MNRPIFFVWAGAMLLGRCSRFVWFRSDFQIQIKIGAYQRGAGAVSRAGWQFGRLGARLSNWLRNILGMQGAGRLPDIGLNGGYYALVTGWVGWAGVGLHGRP